MGANKMAIMSLCLSTNRFFTFQQWDPCQRFELRTLNLPKSLSSLSEGIFPCIPTYVRTVSVAFICGLLASCLDIQIDVTTDQKLASSSG